MACVNYTTPSAGKNDVYISAQGTTTTTNTSSNQRTPSTTKQISRPANFFCVQGRQGAGRVGAWRLALRGRACWCSGSTCSLAGRGDRPARYSRRSSGGSDYGSYGLMVSITTVISTILLPPAVQLCQHRYHHVSRNAHLDRIGLAAWLCALRGQHTHADPIETP